MSHTIKKKTFAHIIRSQTILKTPYWSCSMWLCDKWWVNSDIMLRKRTIGYSSSPNLDENPHVQYVTMTIFKHRNSKGYIGKGIEDACDNVINIESNCQSLTNFLKWEIDLNRHFINLAWDCIHHAQYTMVTMDAYTSNLITLKSALASKQYTIT